MSIKDLADSDMTREEFYRLSFPENYQSAMVRAMYWEMVASFWKRIEEIRELQRLYKGDSC